MATDRLFSQRRAIRLSSTCSLCASARFLVIHAAHPYN